MAETGLSVLTLNCWDLKYLAKNRVERMTAIAIELAKSRYDIIALQELWVQSDYEFIRENVSARLPYAKYFHSGALGAGLALFTRFPIIDSSMHPYSLVGAPVDLSGDWIVAKGVASVVITHPVLGHVQIFTTHFYSGAGEQSGPREQAHVLVNAWEFSNLVLQAARLGRHVIATGDFNCIPSAFPMTIIREYAALTDAWAATNHTQATAGAPGPVSSSTTLTPEEVVRRYGVTADSPCNTYTSGKSLDAHARQYLGKRLDYIFYRQPMWRDMSAVADPKMNVVLKATGTKVVFTGSVPQYDFSFSDHLGLEGTFEIATAPGDVEHASPSSHSASPVPQPAPLQERPLSPAHGSAMVQQLTSAYRSSRSRADRELSVFALCLVALLGVIVGVAWFPHAWISVLFVLFTIVVSWFATTVLYLGFIYRRWEQNVLRELIEELEILKRAAELQGPQTRASYGGPDTL